VRIPATVFAALLCFGAAIVFDFAAWMRCGCTEIAALGRAWATWARGFIAADRVGGEAGHQHIGSGWRYSVDGGEIAAEAAEAVETVTAGAAIVGRRAGIAQAALAGGTFHFFFRACAVDAFARLARIVVAGVPLVGRDLDAAELRIAFAAIAAIGDILFANHLSAAAAHSGDADSVYDTLGVIASIPILHLLADVLGAGLTWAAGVAAIEDGSALGRDRAATAIAGHRRRTAADTGGATTSAALRGGACAAVMNGATVVGKGAAIQTGARA